MIEKLKATKKSCPMMGGTPCRGADCMLWRWATVEQLGAAIHERIRLDDGVGSDPINFVDEWSDSNAKIEGFCGLGGVPSVGF